jgi:hypothetical protein
MSEQDKKKGGRPRINIQLPKGWQDVLLESGREGKHITDFLIKLDMTWDRHYLLLQRNPEYHDVFQNYQRLCEQWWYERAHEAMASGNSNKFNQRLWTIIMKNKFRDEWHDEKKLDISSNGESIVPDTTLQIEIIKKGLINE